MEMDFLRIVMHVEVSNVLEEMFAGWENRGS
jgi:hypothetical protein